LLISVIIILIPIVYRLKQRSTIGWAGGTVILSVATSGFATMALSIIWLFAFQNLYGYVYQRIGWIIALFMDGLIIGCATISKRTEHISNPVHLSKYLWTRLITVDLLIAILALTIPILLPALATLQRSQLTLSMVEWSISIMVALTGILGGVSFALAGGLQHKTLHHTGTAAGSIVAADHTGACIGALFTGILLVPVFGTTIAVFLLAAIKTTSALYLALGKRLSNI